MRSGSLLIEDGVALTERRASTFLASAFLELIEGESGTIWDPSQSGLHHVGVWTDDLAGDIAALENDGIPIEACGRGDDGAPNFWSYHRTPDGLRVELVDGSAKEAFEVWRAGGDLQ